MTILDKYDEIEIAYLSFIILCFFILLIMLSLLFIGMPK